MEKQKLKARGLLRARFIPRFPWAKGQKTNLAAPARLPGLLSHARPVVIGHRGFSAFAPENTLPAFGLALRAGVDLVELDFRATADGELVVFHDPYLDRTTDARLRWGGRHIRVDSKSLAEVRTLDAGSWFGQAFGNTPVPSLHEAVEFIQRRGGVALLERKSGDVEPVARFLEDKKWVGRVVVQSFDWSFLTALHRRLPQQPLGALGPLTSVPGVRKAPAVFGQLTGRWLRALRQTGSSLVVWNKQVSKPAVRQAHDQGLKVWVYTIDRPELAQKLLDIGVDGIITNNPALIWKALGTRHHK